MKNQNYWDLEKPVGKNEIGSLAFLFFLVIAVIIMLMIWNKLENKPEEEPEIVVIHYEYEMPIINKPQVQNIEIEGKEYLESCVEAEAGNQGALGKAYVCDVILNRLDRDCYDTLYDVIDDPGQFQCVSNGSIQKVAVSEETKRVVRDELKSRKDSDIMFFRTGKYHSNTVPCFQYRDHYFSR